MALGGAAAARLPGDPQYRGGTARRCIRSNFLFRGWPRAPDELGIEEVFRRRSGDHDRRALLVAWINTPTWSESLDFFREHEVALTTDDSQAVLDSIDNDAARQHLAILDLTSVLPVEQVYTVVTDPAVAEELAFATIEAGDLPALSAILTAASELQTRPAAWGLIVSVLLLAQDEPDQAHQLGRQVAEEATVIQRRAYTIRLRALRSHHSDLPGLDDLIQIIDRNPGELSDRVRINQ